MCSEDRVGEIVDDVDKCMFSGQQESHGRVGWSYKKAVWRSYYLARPTGGEACKLWCQHSRYTNINKQTVPFYHSSHCPQSQTKPKGNFISQMSSPCLILLSSIMQISWRYN